MYLTVTHDKQLIFLHYLCLILILCHGSTNKHIHEVHAIVLMLSDSHSDTVKLQEFYDCVSQ